MKLAVFGLGYVGAVTAALFAEQGHSVVGVDVNPAKAKAIGEGIAPVIEPGLNEIIAGAVQQGHLSASSDASVADWDVAFVCVGTPSGQGGQLDARALRAVLTQLGELVRGRSDYPVIAIRSTVAPHVLREVVVPTVSAAAGGAPGSHYGLAVVPEFLREGTSVKDFHQPPFTLLGTDEGRTADKLEQLFGFIKAPVQRMSMGEAVMVKYASNAYHALKVAFANEIGLLCAQDGLDSHKVMETFCQDSKLNISKSYLRPGFAFGGSCLPKDLRELGSRARRTGIDTPLLAAVLPSNRAYLERCIDIVLADGRQRIGICGMSFKADTDDLRESPMLTLIETLIGKGKQLAIYDSNVRLAHLTGTNRDYLERTIPHISSLLRGDLQEVIDHAELLVIGYGSREFDGIPQQIRPEQTIIDFSRPLPATHFDSAATDLQAAAS